MLIQSIHVINCWAEQQPVVGWFERNSKHFISVVEPEPPFLAGAVKKEAAPATALPACVKRFFLQ